ncbi:hypothetical protein CXF83_18570 [Shewanella sp. Choline-02u-19]|uniref:hypothetical protein n=1 Tax=unclassified Shewanella TaxID=196818 RepID=UPI000C34BD27|nr:MULTISPECIES: hypothetical protein [unclassified Shewanella]PKH54511.1 hypothetical protein CXF84_19775 [Shewanella sp. Bg11-22]PKI28568.1 hypothetical protein CXF83_18570 [Shewanella sp. Choline-02u-19]
MHNVLHKPALQNNQRLLNSAALVSKQITHVDEIRYMSALTDLVLIDNELTEFDATVQSNLRRLNLTLMSLNIRDGRKLTKADRVH